MTTGKLLTEYGKSSAVMKSRFLEKLRALFENREDEGVASTLNSGLIGIAFDFMASSIEDTYFDINSKSKEIFPTVAKYDDSVYLHAATNKIYNIFATPAYIEALIGIKIEDIETNAVDRPGLGYKMITLSGDSIFALESFYYLIDYPVDISIRIGTNNTKIVSCKYNLTTRNKFSDIESSYIKGKSQFIGQYEYYVFKVKAHQLVKNIHEYTYTPSTISSDIYSIKYTSNLAGFDVYYRKTDDDAWEMLNSLYNGTLIGGGNVKNCYYRLSEKNAIEIAFDTNPDHFIPSFNSRIKVIIYTTSGAVGNFKNSSNNELLLYYMQDITNTYENAMVGITVLTQLLSSESKGGLNKPTLEEIRSMIVDYRSSRNTISSDKDIERLLNSKGIKGVKRRDDIYNRVFMTYALLEDAKSDIILPTRTGELFIKEEELIDQYVVDSKLVPPQNVYQLWLSEDTVFYNFDRFIAVQADSTIDDISPTKALENGNWKYLYNQYVKRNGVLMMCPFLIKIFKDPYFVGIYDIQCNSATQMSFGYNNYNSPEKFSANEFKIIRDDIRSNTYTISCTVSVSDTLIEELYTTLYSEDFSAKVKVELFDTIGNSYAYIELNYLTLIKNESAIMFWTTLETDNTLHPDSQIRIINGKIVPTQDGVFSNTGVIPMTFFIPFSCKVRVYILYRPITPLSNEMANHILSENDRKKGFIVTDMFETYEDCYFVKDLSDIIATTLEVILSQGVWPVYNQDVPATWDKPVFSYNEDGSIAMNENGEAVIIHNIGDPVINPNSGAIELLHRKGDPIISYNTNRSPIYAIPPKITYIIKHVPLVSMITLLNPSYRNSVYKNFKNLTDTVHLQILSKLTENHSISIGVYNTMGPSRTFIQGFGSYEFKRLSNLDISIVINAKLKNSELSSILRTSITTSTASYIKQIMKTGYFYMVDLFLNLKNAYDDIEYIEFISINGATAETQTIKIDETITDYTKITPEYITISQLLDKDAFEKDGTVLLTPNITVNMI